MSVRQRLGGHRSERTGRAGDAANLEPARPCLPCWRSWSRSASLNEIVVGGAHPDLFLLLAISAGLAAGPQRGAVMAFALGLVADLFVQTPYGLSSLCYVLVAFAIGLGGRASRPGGRRSASSSPRRCWAGSEAPCSTPASAPSSASRACPGTSSRIDRRGRHVGLRASRRSRLPPGRVDRRRRARRPPRPGDLRRRERQVSTTGGRRTEPAETGPGATGRPACRGRSRRPTFPPTRRPSATGRGSSARAR